ncbi:MAG: type II toxin-antitoxin system PemK/MazF family toxin [Caldilineaceae bacterium]
MGLDLFLGDAIGIVADTYVDCGSRIGPPGRNLMARSVTQTYADQLGAAIAHAIEAHTHFPNTPRDAVRIWDQRTPYVIHPIWCAMTLLTETALPETIRYPGAIALLWHDTLEDTQLLLPADTEPLVRELVEEMTFASLDEEFERLWERSDIIKLLKLYDKVSQFLDGIWIQDVRWNQLVQHTRRLERFVSATYGELNIVKLSRTLCQPRPGPLTTNVVNQGDIYWIGAGGLQGAEPGNFPHPYVVIQENLLNHSRIDTVVVCALTTNLKQANEPGNILLDVDEAGLSKQSAVVVSKVSTVEKRLLGAYVGRLSQQRIDQILAGMRLLQQSFFTRKSI